MLHPEQLKRQWPKNVNIYDCGKRRTLPKLQMMKQWRTDTFVNAVHFSIAY
jgi:hypothetical protein